MGSDSGDGLGNIPRITLGIRNDPDSIFRHCISHCKGPEDLDLREIFDKIHAEVAKGGLISDKLAEQIKEDFNAKVTALSE